MESGMTLLFGQTPEFVARRFGYGTPYDVIDTKCGSGIGHMFVGNVLGKGTGTEK